MTEHQYDSNSSPIFEQANVEFTERSPRALEIIDTGGRPEIIASLGPEEAAVLAYSLLEWAKAAPPAPLPPAPEDDWPVQSLLAAGLTTLGVARLTDAGYVTVGDVRHATDDRLLAMDRFGQTRLEAVRAAIDVVVTGSWRP